jgi:hypothetical protein
MPESDDVSIFDWLMCVIPLVDRNSIAGVDGWLHGGRRHRIEMEGKSLFDIRNSEKGKGKQNY